MNDVTSAPGLGVYLHVPFCERVCPYCDFAVCGVWRLEEEREATYIAALLRELDLARAQLGDRLPDRPLDTLYFGGGTPSMLQPDSVARLIEAVRGVFPGDPDVTLELNPGAVERARIPGFRKAGVTRASLGVQSLSDVVLKRLGRAHTGADARAGLDACLSAGFASVSADLIYGAPAQSETSLKQDLDVLVESGVPHISAYALTLEPGTPFFRAAPQGKIKLPGEDEALRMGALVCDTLAAAGLERYEISNFARPGHRSRHNQRYWLREDVLGLGVSAGSLVGERRWSNLRDLAAWEQALARGRLPIAESEELNLEQQRREYLFLGFRRLDGIDRARFERIFGSPIEAHFAAEIAELQHLGLIAETSGHWRLTEKGLLFADEVLMRFV
ncbi:MAG: radical SAM family heme chaperone HemW [bacterium]|nr:radical SAM family heme chaperone HemW [bacterium]